MLVRFVLFYLLPALIGFRFGHIGGALMMMAVGHVINQFLRKQPILPVINAREIRDTFYSTSFAVMGHIAKADGHVSVDEIQYTQQLFDQLRLTAEQRQVAITHFRRGKATDFVLQDELTSFKERCSKPLTLITLFLEMQVMMAAVDGAVDTTEKSILEEIFRFFGIPLSELERYLSQYTRASESATSTDMSVGDAYQMLGVKESATFAEIKRAYRKAMMQNHPDRLVSKGLPKEMIEVAVQKTKNLTRAFERIKKHRA